MPSLTFVGRKVAMPCRTRKGNESARPTLPHSVKHGGLTHSVKHGGKIGLVENRMENPIVENKIRFEPHSGK
jgi:hypothetical protein